jgi:hypothetical protein
MTGAADLTSAAARGQGVIIIQVLCNRYLDSARAALAPEVGNLGVMQLSAG